MTYDDFNNNDEFIYSPYSSVMILAKVKNKSRGCYEMQVNYIDFFTFCSCGDRYFAKRPNDTPCIYKVIKKFTQCEEGD